MSSAHHMKVMKHFARRLKAARIAAGYSSAAKFAHMLGMDPHAYRTYERGEASPPLGKLVQICDALGCTPNDLLPAHSKRETAAGSLSPLGDQAA